MPDYRYPQTHPWITFRHYLDRAPPRLWWLLGKIVAQCRQVAAAPLPPFESARMYRLSLVRGARATTAIEGNTLTEEEVDSGVGGSLDLPISRAYLGQEVENVLKAYALLAENLRANPLRRVPLSLKWIKSANRLLLARLEEHLEEGVVPGEVPRHAVGVGPYRGAPRAECEYLLDRLCRWLSDDSKWHIDWDKNNDNLGRDILRGIFSHLYVAWIHPFGDGNGRTARLVEFATLVHGGVPLLSAHLLSNHYYSTHSEYYRQLDRSSRAGSGEGDPLGFVLYALQGLADGLGNQCREIERIQIGLAWEHYVMGFFGDLRTSQARDRRKKLALSMGREQSIRPKPIPKKELQDLTPELTRMYATKTTKTLTRDVNWLVKQGLIEKRDGAYWARVELMRTFLPPAAVPHDGGIPI